MEWYIKVLNHNRLGGDKERVVATSCIIQQTADADYGHCWCCRVIVGGCWLAISHLNSFMSNNLRRN